MKNSGTSINCSFIIFCIDPSTSVLFVCVEVLWPSKPITVMLNAVSLPDHTFSWDNFRFGKIVIFNYFSLDHEKLFFFFLFFFSSNFV